MPAMAIQSGMTCTAAQQAFGPLSQTHDLPEQTGDFSVEWRKHVADRSLTEPAADQTFADSSDTGEATPSASAKAGPDLVTPVTKTSVRQAASRSHKGLAAPGASQSGSKASAPSSASSSKPKSADSVDPAPVTNQGMQGAPDQTALFALIPTAAASKAAASGAPDGNRSGTSDKKVDSPPPREAASDPVQSVPSTRPEASDAPSHESTAKGGAPDTTELNKPGLALESLGSAPQLQDRTLSVAAAPRLSLPAHPESSTSVNPTQIPYLPSQAASEPVMLTASPGTLELGLHTGSHGWVKVKAEVDGQTGEVSAVVHAGSAQSAETLHRELPALSAYLEGEQVALHSLTVVQMNSAPGSDLGNDAAGQQQGRSEQPTRPQSFPQGEEFIDSPMQNPAQTSVQSAYSGAWLSVMA